MSSITFTIRPSASDWDEAIGAWRCPALAIPGANIRDIFLDGGRVDKSYYETLLDQAMIRWIKPEVPQKIAVLIELTETLALSKDTERWKKLAIVLPVVGTVVAASLSAGVTYYTKRGDNAPPIPQSTAQDEKRSSNLNWSDDDFYLAFPRGDKICVFDKLKLFDNKTTSLASYFRDQGISIVDFHDAIRTAYSGLTGKLPDQIGSFIPFNLPQCEIIENPGPIDGRGYDEVQVFQDENNIKIDVSMLDKKAPPVEVGKIGIDWEKFRSGMRAALKVIYKNRVDFELEGVSTLTKPDGSLEYYIGYRKI